MDCEGKVCGVDGCGGQCGFCGNDICDGGICVFFCGNGECILIEDCNSCVVDCVIFEVFKLCVGGKLYFYDFCGKKGDIVDVVDNCIVV